MQRFRVVSMSYVSVVFYWYTHESREICTRGELPYEKDVGARLKFGKEPLRGKEILFLGVA